MGQTRKVNRKSPSQSATECPEGTIKFGKGSDRWVVKKTAGGVHRWVPFASTVLFGYAPLTVGYLAKHIGKPVTVYERQSIDMWPSSRRDFDVKYTFTASGDGELDGKIFSGWLRTRVPPVKKDRPVTVVGKMKSNDIDTIRAAPKPGELVSSNLMNTDAFVKCQ
jgi:hypothetical protein